jgi:hypothetical protein
MQRSETSESKNTRKRGNDNWRALVIVFLLLAIICAGAYLRTIGVDWDAGRHLHPDDRFLSMVLNSMTPVKSVGEYFNTDASTLNPGNVGYDFFVYGTLPCSSSATSREWVGQVGYDRLPSWVGSFPRWRIFLPSCWSF